MNYQPGDQFEDFLLLCHCGTGAYGSVYLARNIISGRIYALKIIPSGGCFSERELNGIRQYQTVCSQCNLMQVYRTGKTDGGFFCVMDAADNLSGDPEKYIPDTLQNRIDKLGRINSSELLETAIHLEQCLNTLHAKGLLHRDIKPANIIFINGEALPGDIGLVTKNKDASLAGTAAFISPQTAAGLRSFGPEDDFYALGKTVYCALTGNPPEKYPSFPEDLDLAECKKIIPLYNRWINDAKPSDRGKKRYYLFLTGMLCLLFFAGIFGYFRSNTVCAPLPETICNIKSYQQETARYAESLRPDEKLRQLLPRLEQQKKKLWNERTRTGLMNQRKPVTPQDLEKARQNPQWQSDPEAYLRMQRKDDAVAEFDRKNQNNPVLRYFSTLTWLHEELRRIEILSGTSGIENMDFSADLETFKKKFSEFEKVREQLISQKF